MSKQKTRYKILTTIHKAGTIGGMTAARIAHLAKVHPATARRHLAEMRRDPTSLYAEYLISAGSERGYRYLVDGWPPKPARKQKAPRRRRSSPVRVAKPIDVLQVQVTAPEPVTVRVRVLTALRGRDLGLHELGQALRVKRNVLQRELDALAGQVTRTRENNRWIYTRAS